MTYRRSPCLLSLTPAVLNPKFVAPAKAGVQAHLVLDSRLRGNDGLWRTVTHLGFTTPAPLPQGKGHVVALMRSLQEEVRP